MLLHGTMYYTYILESIRKPGTRYIGHTSDLRRRLAQHNAGENRSTYRHRPWKVKLYIAFETRRLARDFERYLKSGSGHAFANRHFYPQCVRRCPHADARAITAPEGSHK